jgi:hypothetical protein
LEKIFDENILDTIMTMNQDDKTNSTIIVSNLNFLINICSSFKNTCILHEKMISKNFNTILNGEKNKPVLEILYLIKCLLPKMKPDKIFISDMNYSKRITLFQDQCESAKELVIEKVEKKGRDLLLIEYFEKNEKNMLVFAENLVETLIGIFTSNLNEQIKNLNLSTLGTIFYYSSRDNLSVLLENIQISTFISKLLSSNDLIAIGIFIF